MRRLVFTLFLMLAGCGPGGVGAACFGAPQEGDCVEDAICTPETNRSAIDERGAAPPGPTSFCRQRCDVTADCPTGFACEGVPTTFLASCQPAPAAAP